MATREPSFIERTRRAQLIDVTITAVAEHGYSNVSLARIADNAGITKAAVLYHFRTKDAVVEAAYRFVLDALVQDVAAAVGDVPAQDGPQAYVRAMVGHLRAHPRHTRMLIEALANSTAGHTPEQRWRPLADLIDASVRARGTDGVDSRTLAIITGGAVDAIVTECLHDPDYDSAAAGESLAAMLDAALS
ncbi:TetR family transcriptional regulator [Rhodococcus sp. 14-2483-1-1]|uniref:TetR/AcrR family transcriptional regulator n=1 Tax=unclassified Rhodococcus (in: high G+C Gram-positive bacteria) TaxID=192944 RepID=UPI000B9A81EC|nr:MULTISPECIES: TetR/AcrR family transcriptional regulator [unclassified Rhodococcus (in: high G+C Gram-positive bacteria)]OZE87892.1 TetR family transcriptional regulator [Rhodococcus sp. 15-649-2-2]OZF41029.1 TetR family transcriptional regulator [Rhodococcus sp. 14-2483-1-1]